MCRAARHGGRAGARPSSGPWRGRRRRPPVARGVLRSYVAERHARAAAEKAKDDLQASEARYRLMFDNSPLPKWLYDLETLRFLAVNDAALRGYGYSREEFLAMTIKDIRATEEVPVSPESVRDADIAPKS